MSISHLMNMVHMYKQKQKRSEILCKSTKYLGRCSSLLLCSSFFLPHLDYTAFGPTCDLTYGVMGGEYTVVSSSTIYATQAQFLVYMTPFDWLGVLLDYEYKQQVIILLDVITQTCCHRIVLKTRACRLQIDGRKLMVSLHPSIHPSIYTSIYTSICPSMHPSITLT